MSNVIPFRPRSFTWPHTPLKEPRTEDMRLVVEAQLVAVRETDPVIRLQCHIERFALSMQDASKVMREFGKSWVARKP